MEKYKTAGDCINDIIQVCSASWEWVEPKITFSA